MGQKMKTIYLFLDSHKKTVILICIGAAVLVGALMWLLVWKNGQSAQQEVSYRESTVTKGDVTVGISESGTVTLDSESVTFPVDCDISTVLVKAGTQVKKGDALIQLDVGSVSEGSSETRQKLAEAKVTLQEALNNQKGKLEEAKITYESSKYLSQTASITRQLTEDQLTNAVTSAQTELTQSKKQLADYLALQKTIPQTAPS